MPPTDPTPLPTANPLSPVLGFFEKVLDAILKATGKQLGLIGLVILAVLASLVLAQPGTDPDSGRVAVVVLSLVAGLVVLVTAARNALPAALTVFVFGLAAAYLLFAPPPPPPAEGNLRVAGHVRSRLTNDGVPGARVIMDGFGGSAGPTNEDGYFEFSEGIPRYVVENAGDSLIFMVQHAKTEEFRTSRKGPFRFFVTPPAAPVAAVAPGRRHAPVWLAQTRRVLPGDAPPVRVILDSVRTVQDGTSGWSSWAFEIAVNDEDELDLPHRQYNDDRGKNLVRLGSEVKIRNRLGAVVEIDVDGSRSKQFFGKHRATGVHRIAVADLQPDVPVHRQIPVSVQGNRKEGDFLFFFTVVRMGTPPQPQIQRAARGFVLVPPGCDGCGGKQGAPEGGRSPRAT